MKIKHQYLIAGLAFVLSAGLLVAQENRGPGRGGPRSGSASTGLFRAITIPRDDAEKKILQVLTDLDETQRRGNMTVPEQDGRILRLFTESTGAQQVVELGTSIGYSGIWFCLALQKTGGRLTTYEIDSKRAAQARENFKRAGVDKLVTLVEGDAHVEVAKFEGTIDIVFLDADKEGYLDYLKKLLPKLRPGGLVIAHNMSERQADPNYVKAITTDPSLETVFLNLETSGIGVSVKKR
jgi:caffeoyl-CoA O-methyltransferase